MDANENGPRRTASFAEEKAISPLHDCACYFITMAHAGVERLTRFPFPIGILILGAQYVVGGLTRPFTQPLQSCSLRIFASFDDQIFALVEGCGICSKAELRVLLSPFYSHGFIKASSGLWVKYEGDMKEELRKAVRVVNRVPIINLVTPLFLFLVTPFVRTLSGWLTKQGERQPDVSRWTGDDPLLLIVKNVDPMSTRHMSKAGEQNEGSTHDRKGHPFDGLVSLDDMVKNEGFYPKNLMVVVGSDKNLVKDDDSFHTKQTVNIDEDSKDDTPTTGEDANRKKGFLESTDSIARGTVEDDCAAVRDLEIKEVIAVSEKEALFEAGNVLEMLESSWHLGTSPLKDIRRDPR